MPPWPPTGERPESPFEIKPVVGPGGELVIGVAGEVDRDNAGHLRAALLDLVCRQASGQRVLLQLSRVPLLDAAGIRVLLAIYEAARARGVTVTVTGLSPVIRSIAAVAGLTPMLAPDDLG